MTLGLFGCRSLSIERQPAEQDLVVPHDDVHAQYHRRQRSLYGLH